MSFLLIFLSGMFEGYMDVLQFHYAKFKKKHPKVDGFFWDAEISWVNKYDENFKPKFFGSTTFLVFLTDGWHLMKWLRNVCFFSCIVFIPDNFNMIILALILYMTNRLGFNMIYKLIYK